MLTILRQYPSLEFIGPIEWDKIFATWKKYESGQDSWKKHWEKRGYSSWDEWRQDYASPLKPETRKWFLYRINKPLEEFSTIYGVPSHSWVEKAYGGKTTMKLEDILDLPIISENPKVLNIKKDFPGTTMFTGLVYDDKIVLVEGMHRACALASWDKDKPLGSEITIALARWDKKEIPIIGGNWKNKK